MKVLDWHSAPWYSAPVIELVQVEAWRCTECGWRWFNRKDGVVPKRCPRRSCRKLGSTKGVMPNGELPEPKQPKREVTEGHRAEKTSAGGHETKSCKVYKCGLCATEGVKDARRGLK